MTVRWLVTNQDPELRLAGVRIMAIIVGFSGVVGNPGGPSLLQETIVTTLDILYLPLKKCVQTHEDTDSTLPPLSLLSIPKWCLANVSPTNSGNNKDASP